MALDKIYLFTYGTMRREYRNHHYLEKGIFLGKARSVQKFIIKQIVTAEYPEGYPMSFPSDDEQAIPLHGEIYEIDESMLMAIDKLEDYPHEYNRILTAFTLENGAQVNALIYIGKESENDL